MIEAIFSVDALWWLILLLYIPSCIGLIAVVLLQKGKGVGFAGAFGMGGGSEAVFGPRSARSLPQRLTYIMAGVFMLLSLVMSTISGKVGRGAAPDTVDEVEMVGSSGVIDRLFEDESGDAASTAADPLAATTTAAPAEAPAVVTAVETAADPTPAEAPAAEDAAKEEEKEESAEDGSVDIEWDDSWGELPVGTLSTQQVE